MTITNDKIEFTTADFDGFSEPVKKALTGFLEDYAKHFAASLNTLVFDAQERAKNLAAQAPSVASVLESYAAADEAKRDSAEPFITDLLNHLNS